mgnify:CR=1 FL=1
MEQYLLSKFVKILEDEKDIKGIQQYKNLLGEDVVSFWIDNTQYLISIDAIFSSGGSENE